MHPHSSSGRLLLQGKDTCRCATASYMGIRRQSRDVEISGNVPLYSAFFSVPDVACLRNFFLKWILRWVVMKAGLSLHPLEFMEMFYIKKPHQKPTEKQQPEIERFRAPCLESSQYRSHSCLKASGSSLCKAVGPEWNRQAHILAQKISKSSPKCERHSDQQIMCDRSLCLLFKYSSGIRAFFFTRKVAKAKKIYRLVSKEVKVNPTISAVGNFLVNWLLSENSWEGHLLSRQELWDRSRAHSFLTAAGCYTWSLSCKGRSAAGLCSLQQQQVRDTDSDSCISHRSIIQHIQFITETKIQVLMLSRLKKYYEILGCMYGPTARSSRDFLFSLQNVCIYDLKNAYYFIPVNKCFVC